MNNEFKKQQRKNNHNKINHSYNLVSTSPPQKGIKKAGVRET